VFEEVIPGGVPAAMREVVAEDFLDHDPLPGQPAGVAGAEYVVATMHGAHPDLRFSIDYVPPPSSAATAAPATQRALGGGS